MWQSEELDNHLKTSDTIQTEAAAYAEWNMNQPGNVARIGNYRYRPTYTASQYYLIPMSYDSADIGNYYTGATDSDVAIDSGFDDQDQPTLFVAPKEKMKTLYSLEDCLKPHRPRSGINKPIYLGNEEKLLYSDVNIDNYSTAQYITNPSPIDKLTDLQVDNQNYIVNRPRYYMSHKDDLFKYWTSFRTEYGFPTPRPGQPEATTQRQVEHGISFIVNDRFYIEDTAPFVVYKDQVPTNKIVLKMQTNVGDIDLGNVRYGNESIPDPLYGDANKTTPVIWRIEKLNEDSSWEELINFDEASVRSDGSPIIGADGYFEISYGLQIPSQYESIFIFADTISNVTLLPEVAPVGYAYLVKENEHDRGTMYIYVDTDQIESFVPDYSWQISNETINYNSKFVTQINDPDYFYDINGNPQYREFEWISGMRIVVETMNKPDCTFDLIEMSPRLTVDISHSVSSFSITKTMSDLGNGSIPVGGLFASTGQIEIFDTDFSFNSNNAFNFDTRTGSILANYLDMPIKFLFYDITRNVNNFDYFVPVKTLYSESFPQATGAASNISINLRDFFFYLESMPAPELLLTNVSLSWAITILLDYAGFTNYTFKRVKGYPEAVIPYFFVEPDQNVATVLQKLAMATQSAMFFDEYNNFITMSKEYLLPGSELERGTNSTLYGQTEGENLPNIINLSSTDKVIYNDGQINYTVRYIQRSIGSTQTAQKLDQYKQYIYKPVLLWEVQGRESTKTINQLGAQNSGYTLGAVPLNTDLTDALPYAENNTIFNNIIDVGENVYWLPSFAGYLYANGEVIRFDAVEYTVSGEPSPVWITNNQEYQNYMAALKFNGKMYPTGNLRIYTKPEYEIIDGVVNIKNGLIKEHGRGQFGTPVTNHLAGLDEYWTQNSSVRGCIMDSEEYLFTTSEYIEYPDGLVSGIAGKIQENPYVDADIRAQSSTRSGIIRNFLADKYATEEEINYYKTTGPGSIQSSALIITGPKFNETLPKPSAFISYVYKDFVDQNGEAIPYQHFGTRMRIVGKIELGTNSSQTPIGGYPIFEGSASSAPLTPNAPNQQIKVFGGSGGMAFGINKETNNGYFYEIVALTADNVEGYISNNNPALVVSKILSSPAASSTNNTVTVYTENPISFEVGQPVLISGLSDSSASANAKTPLNGEYTISAISTNKKSFQYIIPTPSASVVSITSASANGSVITYTIPFGNTRASYIKPGDKVNISGTSSPAFNINGAIVQTFNQLNTGWTFTVNASASGSATGGTATYVPLTTTSNSGGTASQVRSDNTKISNVYFYKIMSDGNGKAIPVRLWTGLAEINVDSGDFVGQNRLAGEDTTTVYDLSAEYINIGTTRRFFLYLNGKQVATVDDTSPLKEYNNMALFTRGSSRCMFENIYALANNYSQNTTFTAQTGIAQIFGDDQIDASEALRKYALSGMIQKTYLSGISSAEQPKYKIYFEEFGTIMREMAYFNIKYDRAYPALYAKLMKTMNRIKGYSTSGFYAGSYGADFLIFNCTDFNLNLDDTSGNYLRIQGIAFTQDTTYTLSVDDYFKKKSILLDNEIGTSSTINNPFKILEEYNKIKNSRIKYGVNEFTPIDSPYIQSTDVAEDVFGWIINKVSVPKKVVGINTFATSNLQLGDIVTINYKDPQGEGINIISPEDTRYIIYNMEYQKDVSGLITTLYLVEI